MLLSVMTLHWGVRLLLVSALFFLACEDKLDPITEPEDGDLPETVTYAEHVKTLLDSHCIMCHTSHLQGANRNGAPPDVNLDTYEASVAVAERANTRIQSGTMPPTGGLNAADRALFQKWVDQGMQE